MTRGTGSSKLSNILRLRSLRFWGLREEFWKVRMLGFRVQSLRVKHVAGEEFHSTET